MSSNPPDDIAFLITDIDGTITDAQGRIDLEAVRLMRELEDAGVVVGLVSGRPFPMVLMLAEYIGLSGPLIAENGGALKFAGTTYLLGSRAVAEDAVRRLSGSFALHPTWDNAWRVSDCAFERNVGVDALRTAIAELLLNVDVQASSIMVHIGEKGVTKRTALERWLELSGASCDEVLVAGDSDTDRAMFEAFRHSVAPSTSTEEILRLARYRSNSAYALGFCEGLRHYHQAGAFRLRSRL